MSRERVYRALAAQEGEYLSGQELSRRLGISRAAVWKAVETLRRDGCQIEARTGCGYRLAEYEKRIPDDAFQALSFLDLPLGGAALREKTRALFEDGRYGRILRVKGFYREGEQGFCLNATAEEFKTEPAPESRAALLVIGSGLDEDAINVLLTGHAPEHHIL